MSNFILPDSYVALEKKPATKQFPKGEFKLALKGIQSYFPTVHVPVGTIIYRGDKGDVAIPRSNMPAFFGNRKLADRYAAANDKKISKYRITKELTLLELNLNSVYNLQKALIAHMPGFLTDDQMELVYIWCDMETGAIRPSIPIGPEDASGHIPYLNRFMAELVCRLGFDGWIVFPYDPSKRQGLIQISVIHGRVAYSPEIMVCRWMDHMEKLVGGGVRYKTFRKTRSNYRKTNKNKNK
jgi:hypothetical protein